jgi:hypothetical protein
MDVMNGSPLIAGILQFPDDARPHPQLQSGINQTGAVFPALRAESSTAKLGRTASRECEIISSSRRRPGPRTPERSFAEGLYYRASIE